VPKPLEDRIRSLDVALNKLRGADEKARNKAMAAALLALGDDLLTDLKERLDDERAAAR
jgi:hypothetical protein